MANTAQQIADAIYAYIRKTPTNTYSDYYVGITNDIDRRLFREHRVSRIFDSYVCYEAIDKNAAQAVEEHFLGKGMVGDTGGGTEHSVYVYCYRITENTMQ